jgi:hypothetical protein
MTRNRQTKPVLTSPDVDAMTPAERELWRRANPNLAIDIRVDALERKLSEELELPPDRKVEFRTEPLQPSTDIVMVEGRIPVSAPLARELVADGILTSGDASHGPSLSAEIVAKMARSLDKAYRTHLPLEQWKGPLLEQPPAYEVLPLSDRDAGFLESVKTVTCDSDCPRRRASWPGCCKLNDRVEMSDVFEPAGPDSFGGEDGMHSPAAATIREQIEQGIKRRQNE